MNDQIQNLMSDTHKNTNGAATRDSSLAFGSDGFYWWRRSPDDDWELAKVVASPFLARFYNGSRISDHPWGEWKKAEVSSPNRVAIEPSR